MPVVADYTACQGRDSSLDSERVEWDKACDRADCSLILPPAKDNIEVYTKIKRAGDLTYGKHTVCAISTKITNGDAAKRSQFLENSCPKVNVKMRGEPHAPDLLALDRVMGEDERRSTLISGAVSQASVLGACTNRAQRRHSSSR